MRYSAKTVRHTWRYAARSACKSKNPYAVVQLKCAHGPLRISNQKIIFLENFRLGGTAVVPGRKPGPRKVAHRGQWPRQYTNANSSPGYTETAFLTRIWRLTGIVRELGTAGTGLKFHLMIQSAHGGIDLRFLLRGCGAHNPDLAKRVSPAQRGMARSSQSQTSADECSGLSGVHRRQC